MYFVYVLQSEKDQSLYIGYTARKPEVRLEEHNKGENISTKHRIPYKIIYYEAYPNKLNAIGREKFLKGGSGRKYLYKQLKNHLAQNPIVSIQQSSKS
jgi:putative endonuclease